MKTTTLFKALRVAGVGLAFCAATVSSWAAETPPVQKSALVQFFEQDYLFGDWGGWRTDLHNRGVDFEFFYAGSLPSNVGGGIERGTIYQGALLMTLDLNSEKLAGYEGGTFHAGSLWLHGQKPFSDRFIGDLNKVNLVDYNNAFRLWELYYQQKFLDDKVTFKAGQLDIGMDFIVPEYYNSISSLAFLNQTFFFPTMAFNVYDQPYYPVGNHGLSSTPNASPGALLRVDFRPDLYAQAAVYDGNPDRSNGANFKLSSDEGALSYFELGYRHNASTNSAGAPGNLKLGAWYHTDDFVDEYEGTFNAFDNYVAANGIPLPPVSPGPAKFRGGNWGVYFLADHVLWLEKNRQDPALQGLTGFFRVAYAPPDRNLAELGIDGGLVYKGLIPSRDWDTLGLGLSYLKISDDLRRAQRDINAGFGSYGPVLPSADYEGVIEMNYKMQVAAWWTLQTSVQRVFHPGGRVAANIPDAWAVIVQTTLRF
ncbi:MAG: carbohydrate porin [Verrucomicrobia bacterium]|nr:MAG: carbohydrate porin [Verrucomicrobiota bacterium]